MALVTEDFSFPKLTTTNASLAQISISSPSIWRISSLVYPDHGDDDDNNDDEEDRREATRKHKSFSEFEVGDLEARMDLLWQDFNEKELQRVTSLDGRIKTRCLTGSDDNVGRRSANSGRDILPPDRDTDYCTWNSKAAGRRRSLVRGPRRTSTVVLLRALRKLFSIQNLTRNRKR